MSALALPTTVQLLVASLTTCCKRASTRQEISQALLTCASLCVPLIQVFPLKARPLMGADPTSFAASPPAATHWNLTQARFLQIFACYDKPPGLLSCGPCKTRILIFRS